MTTTNIVQQLTQIAAQQQAKNFISENQSMLKHGSEIEQVISWLDDKASRQQYMQELVFLMLKQMPEFFCKNFSPFRLSQEKLIDQKFKEIQKTWPEPQLLECDSLKLFELCYKHTFISEQYRYDDKCKVELGDIFIDCGPYIGDTAIWAYQNGASIVHCFEPSSACQEYTRHNLAKFGYRTDTIYPFAVNDHKGNINFCILNNDHSSSKIFEDIAPKVDLNELSQSKHTSIVQVPSIRLDDWCQDNNVVPTFIKMDIEGSEFSALQGCQEIISKHKPKLAICLYHNTSDMWTIPHLIHSLCSDYKFYCRKHNYGNEFVMYAC